VHLQENLKRLARQGFDITLLCSNFPGGQPEIQWEGIRIIRRGGRFDFNWRAPFLIRRLLKAELFDIVIEDINKIPFYSPLYHRLPVLAIVPHMFATTVFHEINFILATYIYLFEHPVKWAYRQVPFCVISDSTRQDLVDRGFSRDQVTVLHCGIDTERYNYDLSVPKSEVPLVLYVGRLKKYKSVQHLIEAFARLRVKLPNTRLAIVGEGDYRPQLQAQAARLGVGESVTFTGFIPHEEKLSYLRRAHVAVYPSLKEGWGLTNIEANACGTPAVASDVPGLRDSVRHDVTGRLYPFGNIECLTQDLYEILTNEPLQKRYAEGAREWARSFDWDEAATKLGELIDRIIAGAKTKGQR
jgi:glycosyltransferase involved in cell wall biosynthesis